MKLFWEIINMKANQTPIMNIVDLNEVVHVRAFYVLCLSI